MFCFISILISILVTLFVLDSDEEPLVPIETEHSESDVCYMKYIPFNGVTVYSRCTVINPGTLL